MKLLKNGSWSPRAMLVDAAPALGRDRQDHQYRPRLLLRRALCRACSEKLFQKYGLEPDISYVQGGPLALQAVLTKQADVGILSATNTS